MIVTKLVGGLGNQMFQYAIARNLAEKNRTNVKLDIAFLLDRIPRNNFIFRNYDLDLLNIKEDFTLPSIIAKTTNISLVPRLVSTLTSKIKYKIYNESVDFSFDQSALSLPDNTYLFGYWQSEKYFKEIESIIRIEFTFKNKFDEKSSIIAKRVLDHNSICLNVRRTDYVSDQKTSNLLGALGLDYYETAVNRISQIVKNPYFFIFSDDIEWCRENIKLNFPHEVIGHEFAGYKFSSYLQLMILCKHYIIPNSTFAWWGAWLNPSSDKTVIGPKRWFINKKMNNNDILPDSWIKV